MKVTSVRKSRDNHLRLFKPTISNLVRGGHGKSFVTFKWKWTLSGIYFENVPQPAWWNTV